VLSQFQSHIGPISTVADAAAGAAILAATPFVFQSHIGPISTVVFWDATVQAVEEYRRFQSHIGPISTDTVHAADTGLPEHRVSIPYWSDFNRSIMYSDSCGTGRCFNPILVRFQLNGFVVPIAAAIASIRFNPILVRFQQILREHCPGEYDVSIPYWSDFNDLTRPVS